MARLSYVEKQGAAPDQEKMLAQLTQKSGKIANIWKLWAHSPLTLETFMPGGKLVAFPHKQEQILAILNEVATKFEPEKKYQEREVNVILEEVNEDYCSVRRWLVDYGYLSRSAGVYTKNA